MEPQEPRSPAATPQAPGVPPSLGIPQGASARLLEDTTLASIDAASVLLNAAAEGADVAPARYGFETGGLAMLLPEDVPSELVELPPPSPLPNTRVWLRGLVNIRGNLVPVYDLDRLLSEADPVGDRAAARAGTVVPLRRPVLLVLGSGESMAGLALDRLPRALDALALKQRPAPATLPELVAPHVRTVLHDGTHNWLEFDPDSLFSGLRSLVQAR